MANDVVVRFLLQGMPDVTRALRTVEQAAAHASRAMPVRTTPTPIARDQAKRDAVAIAEANRQRYESGLGIQPRMRSRFRPSPSFEGPPAPTPAMQRAAMEGPPEPTAAQRRKADAAVEANAKARVKAELKADAEIRKSREREAKKVAADVAKHVKDRETAQKKLADMMRKDREKENNAILADVAKIQRAEEAARKKKEIKDARDAAKLAKQQDDEARKFQRGVGHAVGHSIMHGVGAAASRVFATSKNVVGMVTGVTGGFSIGESVARGAHDAGQLEDLLNAATNKASDSKFNQQRQEAKDIAPQIQGTAMRYGLSREDVQGGLREMVAMSADFETSLKLMPKIAELARAEGASFHDLAKAAGDVVFAFTNVKDSGEKAKVVMEVMRGLGGQGKAGNVDMRQQATQIGRLIASASRFDPINKADAAAGSADEAALVKGNVTNILKMGALMQFARGGGGAITPSMAGSAVTAFSATFSKPARLKKFQEDLGMGEDKIFSDKARTMLRPPEDILADALKASGGAQPKMMAALGSVMGDRAVHVLQKEFTDAEKVKKGTGEAAMRKRFDKMIEDAMMNPHEVTHFAAKRTGALDAQIEIQRQKFDAAVQEKVIPKLLDLVPVLEKLTPMIVDLSAQAIPAFVELIKTVGEFAAAHKSEIADMASHPIGTILALEVTKSLASAGLGEVVRGIFLKAAGMLPGAKGGTPGGPGAEMGAGGIGVALGVASGAVIGNAMLKYEVGTDRAKDLAAKLDAWKRGERDPSRAMSPEQVQAEVDAAKKRLKEGSTLENTANLILSPVLDASSRDYKKYKADQGLVDNEELTKALKDFADNKDLISAMNNFADSAKALRDAKPNPGGVPPGVTVETNMSVVPPPPAAYTALNQRR